MDNGDNGDKRASKDWIRKKEDQYIFELTK
jgi:hypothetical protein